MCPKIPFYIYPQSGRLHFGKKSQICFTLMRSKELSLIFMSNNWQVVEEEDEEEEIEEVVDIMSKDAMYNAYFICHNVQVSLNLG